MFSIIIPTFNNLEYLKLCLESIKKNSKFNHQIIVHINVGSDGTKEYLKSKNIEFTSMSLLQIIMFVRLSIHHKNCHSVFTIKKSNEFIFWPLLSLFLCTLVGECLIVRFFVSSLRIH